MKNFSVIARMGLVGAGAVGSYFLLREGRDLYHGPYGEAIRNATHPLIGLGAGISQGFATAPEEIRNEKGWKHYVKGIGIGTAVGVLPTSLLRMWDKREQFAPESLKGQAPVAQLLEDIAAVGVTLGVMYAATAVAMNIYEAAHTGITGSEWYRNRQARRAARIQVSQRPATPVEAERIP